MRQLCRICNAKPQRKGDTRCWKCASPNRGSTPEANIRRAQRRLYRAICQERIERLLCELCEHTVATKGDLEVDHINGNHCDNRQENYQVLCRPCHIIKGKLKGDYTRKSH